MTSLSRALRNLHAGSDLKPKVILFHCASVGEFEQARPIMDKLHSQLPDYRLVLSFFSPSGYDLKKNYAAADIVTYLPVDTISNAKKFIEIINPALVVIIKYEFWPNFLIQCRLKNIPVISASAIFREDQLYFKWWGGFFLYALRGINQFFVQDENSRKIIQQHGINHVTVAGDTRFDRVFEIKEKGTPVREVSEFIGTDQALVIGSAWPEDINILAPVLKKFCNKVKFIIVPHEVDEDSLHAICSKLPDHQRLSQLSGNLNSSILVVDKMGLLSRIYSSGKFAWVGGGYGKGIHNILEPAVYGLPVFFGNRNFQKFREANELIRAGAAFAITDSAEFERYFQRLLDDSEYASRLNKIAGNYVAANRGATEIIISSIIKNLRS